MGWGNVNIVPIMETRARQKMYLLWSPETHFSSTKSSLSGIRLMYFTGRYQWHRIRMKWNKNLYPFPNPQHATLKLQLKCLFMSQLRPWRNASLSCGGVGVGGDFLLKYLITVVTVSKPWSLPPEDNTLFFPKGLPPPPLTCDITFGCCGNDCPVTKDCDLRWESIEAANLS